mgnify:CR=1 FL=1
MFIKLIHAVGASINCARTSKLMQEYPKVLPNRKSTRFQGYDYSQNGLYYVTICTNKHKQCFGSVVDQRMFLSDMGMVVKRHISNLASYYDEAFVYEHIIMPNHLHRIIAIDRECAGIAGVDAINGFPTSR